MEPLFDRCRNIRFGAIEGEDLSLFYCGVNDAITDLCRSLPGSLQAEGMLFFMTYAGIRMGEPLDFFRNYYQPAWSILPRLAALAGGEIPGLDALRGAHAMAMSLHSLDDHLVDGEVPVSHLALVIRSQMWRRMAEGIDSFATAVPGGPETARGLIDEYYRDICSERVPGSLVEYCALFRGQMATSLVAPLLLARRVKDDDDFIADVRGAYESFGIAWRLLDDIQDIGEDAARGTRSAVYVSLDNPGRGLWDDTSRGEDGTMRLCGIIENSRVIENLAGHIVAELGSAAERMERRGMNAMADEFRALAKPVADASGLP
ncbi:MAG: hypothetical protein JW838_16130 [Spirochaetes bacterium]|nr:hypothetical protein [Spirochaetota bacterium]